MRVRLALGLGGLAAAPPADDPVERESDENQECERCEVDGWAGVRGESRGCED